MCLAIPGKVEEITNDGLIRMGRVNFGGVIKNVCLDYVPEVGVGDYTIVHVGFALSKLDEATAEQTLADFRAMGVLDEELADEEEAFARAAKTQQSNCPDGSCEPDCGKAKRKIRIEDCGVPGLRKSRPGCAQRIRQVKWFLSVSHPRRKDQSAARVGALVIAEKKAGSR